MPKTTAESIGEALSQARNATEIQAREQSYAAATAIATQVLTRYGSHEAPAAVKYWTELADGIFKKINGDMREMFVRK